MMWIIVRLGVFLMGFREWWRKKTIMTKSIWLGIFFSFFVSLLHIVTFTVGPSLNRGKLICGTFADSTGCGNILGFLIHIIFMLILGFIYLIIPIIILSMVGGWLIRLWKK